MSATCLLHSLSSPCRAHSPGALANWLLVEVNPWRTLVVTEVRRKREARAIMSHPPPTIGDFSSRGLRLQPALWRASSCSPSSQQTLTTAPELWSHSLCLPSPTVALLSCLIFPCLAFRLCINFRWLEPLEWGLVFLIGPRLMHPFKVLERPVCPL